MTKLSLLFCGDFAPVRRFEAVIAREGSTVFGDLQSDIASADIAFLNLEAPLSERGVPMVKDGERGRPGLRAMPECIHAIADAGFDVVGLANNHVMDYGEVALADTIALCKANSLSVCGAGQDLAAAQEPLIIEKKGLRVAIVAVAEHQFGMADSAKAGVAPLDVMDNLRQLEAAKSVADLVFVSIHGGNEFFEYPRPGLKKICRFFVERGADAVICHHSHVPGVHEMYLGKPIVYSLGNLVFDHTDPPPGWCEGFALQLSYSVSDRKLLSTELIPYTQSLAQGGIRRMRGEQRDRFLRSRELAADTFHDPVAYQAKWEEFCDSKSAFVILRNYSPVWSGRLANLDRYTFLHKLFLPRATVNIKANIVRCQSHREVLVAVLNKKAMEPPELR